MFKVSFKDTEKSPSKVVTKAGNITKVILRGTIALPDFWKYMPEHIDNWLKYYRHVDGYEDISRNRLTLFAKGVAKCNPDDHYDTVLGERLAEARAKYVIYKLLYDLTPKLSQYYMTILYGNKKPVANQEPVEGILKDVDKYKQLCLREKQHQLKLLNHE